MSLFILDTAGDNDLLTTKDFSQTKQNVKRKLLEEKPTASLLSSAVKAESSEEEEEENDAEDDGDYFGLPPPNVDLSNIIESALAQTERRKTNVEHQMDHAAELVDAAAENAKILRRRRRRGRVMELDHTDFNEKTGKLDDEKLIQTDVEKEMSKSEFVTGFEQLKELPSITKKKQTELNRLERSKTKGAGWFNLPATEMSEEITNDLKILKMRSVLNPKHFYKKNDLKVLPKYFQIGTVQHSALDHYSERNTRKNKKKSLVEELLADAEFQKYNKRKYNDIIARKEKYAHRKAIKKMKKLKKHK